MKNIIIGTAGHVDHGKTRLIKALSGIDTDRLEEEKKRGITIELGFAHIPNDAGYNIGVIDVPGHEKFIKNMLAGIGGIDFVLFVVAADEGIMPQTKEHFEILKALGIDDGIIAVTKTDMVDGEWLEMLLEEVDDYFKGSFLEGKPVIPVSAATGDNIGILKEEIIRKCEREIKRREEPGLFRLPVDRVFTMPGFGTVVTGTMVDGTVSVGDDVMIYPHQGRGAGGSDGTRARVRGIQTYGKETTSATAGQRTAINLTGVGKEDIERGNVIAAKDAVSVTSMIDVKLNVFSSSDRIILNNSRVHLYTGSDEVIAKVILLDRDALGPEEECFAQLRLEEPIAVRREDRFIVRFYSPIITIGGGIILDTMPVKHKRNREEVLAEMEVLGSCSLSDIILAKTSGRTFVKQDELAHELGLLPEEMQELTGSLTGCSGPADREITNTDCADASTDAAGSGKTGEDQENAESVGGIKPHPGCLVRLGDGTLLSCTKLAGLKDDIGSIIESYHAANPLADGIPRQELLSRLRKTWFTSDDKMLLALTKYLTETGFIEDRGKSTALSGFKIEYTPEQQKLKETISDMYIKADLEMVKTDEIYSLGIAGEGKGRGIINAILDDLAAEGVIRKVNPSYYISVSAWEKAKQVLLSFDEPFTLADYRDRLGTSRKYASELLPAFDKEGLTRFDGTVRISALPSGTKDVPSPGEASL